MIYGGCLHRGMLSFIEIKERTYRDLPLEFLSTLHVVVTRGPQCQAGYIFFYFQEGIL